eukprot:TRINITY_DN94707_c0_g1_i1.p1 TRINITY_DN94707_c0_g1~~TRINITY_DN94707_c0_g1_i1.p1  ORF type:complete len:395 (+),score=66.74 TRINITY_DN94707_c0_g1_i1:28-1212(+)
MSFFAAFESATSIDVPDQIAGVDIPNMNMGDIAGIAGDLIDGAAGLGDLVEKFAKIGEVLALGTKTAGNCWGVVDQAYEVVSRIAQRIQPLEPLLRCELGAIAMFTKENLDECVRIICDIIDLGKLLEMISTVLDGTKQIFLSIMEACGGVLDKLMDFASDAASAFAESLQLESVMQGIGDVIADICSLISNLADISNHLGPILDAWQEASFFEASTFAMSNFDDTRGALERVMPSWDDSQRLYDIARGYGQAAFTSAKTARSEFKCAFSKLCDMLGVDIPGGLDAFDFNAAPDIAPRGGFEVSQIEANGGFEGDRRSGLKSLFSRYKDLPHGLSYEQFRNVILNLDGLDDDEIDRMIETCDADGNGYIDHEEFIDWLYGDMLDDNDRDVLKEA